MRNLSRPQSRNAIFQFRGWSFLVQKYFIAAFLTPRSAHVLWFTFACHRQPRGALRASSTPSQRDGTPDTGARPARGCPPERRGNEIRSDNDNNAHRNRSEPNASALGIELTEQASSSGQLTPTLTIRATLRLLSRRRENSDEERAAAAGESASPSRGSRKHQRARQQHQRVGQIIPTYPLASRERVRRRVRGKRGKSSSSPQTFPPASSSYIRIVLSLSLFFSRMPSLSLSFSRSLGHSADQNWNRTGAWLGAFARAKWDVHLPARSRAVSVHLFGVSNIEWSRIWCTIISLI